MYTSSKRASYSLILVQVCNNKILVESIRSSDEYSLPFCSTIYFWPNAIFLCYGSFAATYLAQSISLVYSVYKGAVLVRIGLGMTPKTNSAKRRRFGSTTRF